MWQVLQEAAGSQAVLAAASGTTSSTQAAGASGPALRGVLVTAAAAVSPAYAPLADGAPGATMPTPLRARPALQPNGP